MLQIDTPVGPARVDVAAASSPLRTLVLGHGAGGGIDARDLVALARALPARGTTVLRVEQPWRVAGRRVATPPATLDVAWLAVLPQLPLAGRLVVGGRSAGARVACRTAMQVGAVGCLSLAFPLHPPGRPDRSRAGELRAARDVSVLMISGSRDPFGIPDPADAAKVVIAPGQTHALGGCADLITAETGVWLREVLQEVLVTSGRLSGPHGSA